jgi:DNA-directed RNA polymerase subunit RPC12/RpoP
MYEDAGRVRAKSSELVIRKTDVSLDLNTLLQQIKEGGIVAVYRCPHCSAALKIGSKTDSGSLRKCEHCGNEIEAMDLVQFLKAALT